MWTEQCQALTGMVGNFCKFFRFQLTLFLPLLPPDLQHPYVVQLASNGQVDQRLVDSNRLTERPGGDAIGSIVRKAADAV